MNWLYVNQGLHIYSFKIEVLQGLINWLSNYVIELLRFSFFVIKEDRLKFYHFNYFNAIKQRQLVSWLNQDKIQITNEFATDINYLDLKFSMLPKFEEIEIESLNDDHVLEQRFKYASTVLNAVCYDLNITYRSDTYFYNKIKDFYLKCTEREEKMFYFEFKFESQLQNLDHDKLIDILGRQLKNFYAKYNLVEIEIGEVKVYEYVKQLEERKILYVDLKASLIKNLQLNGHTDLINCVIQKLDTSIKNLGLREVNEFITNFIKKIRLKRNDEKYVLMKKGLTRNKHLTKHLLNLYLNDLIANTIDLKEDSNSLVLIDSDKLIFLSNDKDSTNDYFTRFVDNLPEYNLSFKSNRSFINIETHPLADQLSKNCYFNHFQLILGKEMRPINFQNEIFNLKNMKSSFSFNSFEKPERFKHLLIGKFLKDFKFFNLDECLFKNEEVLYTLFNHFSYLSIQILHYIDNCILLCKDENPKLILDFIFDILYNLFKQIKYQAKLMPNFKLNIDFFTLFWLIVQSFKISWSLLASLARPNEFELIRMLENLATQNLRNDEIKNFDLENTFKKTFLNIEFGIRIIKNIRKQ